MVGVWNLFKIKYSSETAWRLSFIVPASIVLLVAIGQLFLADDCPKGNYKELEAHGAMTRKSSAVSFRKVGSRLKYCCTLSSLLHGILVLFVCFCGGGGSRCLLFVDDADKSFLPLSGRVISVKTAICGPNDMSASNSTTTVPSCALP